MPHGSAIENGNGDRPPASRVSVLNLILGIVAVVTLLGGGLTSAISMTNAIAEMRADVRVLQSQMTDVRSDVHEVVKAVRAAK